MNVVWFAPVGKHEGLPNPPANGVGLCLDDTDPDYGWYSTPDSGWSDQWSMNYIINVKIPELSISEKTEMPNYVYDETEVKLTGRKAKRAKPTQQVQRRRSVSGTGGAEAILYEITPIDDVLDWKKWVTMDDLFEVIDDEEEDEEEV